ncbi:MAG: hypothetical protein NW241_08660 [Bacteroidia bacterium]|nr:hypothetical protein [Bacteroidia bacterium]
MKIGSFFPVRLAGTAALVFALFSLTLTSCKQDGETLAEDDLELAEQDAQVEAVFDDVESYGVEAMELFDGTSFQRPFAGVHFFNQVFPNGCPVITHDTAAKVITVDFGPGCTGPHGRVYAGEIIVNYTQRLYRPGAVLTVTLDSFYVDGAHIEGTKTITNVSPNFQAPISLNTVLAGGQVTWPDGSTATRSFNRTSTWLRAPNPAADQLTVSGSATGVRRNGTAYTMTITTPLVYKRACRIQGIRMAVEGERLIQRSGKPDVTVNFGTGDCDELITVTVNGNSQVIDLGN